jgi:hypothetical protein
VASAGRSQLLAKQAATVTFYEEYTYKGTEFGRARSSFLNDLRRKFLFCRLNFLFDIRCQEPITYVVSVISQSFQNLVRRRVDTANYTQNG